MWLTLEKTRGKSQRFGFAFVLSEEDTRQFQKNSSLIVMNRDIWMLKKWYQFWKK